MKKFYSIFSLAFTLNSNLLAQIPLSTEQQWINWSDAILFTELLSQEYMALRSELSITSDPNQLVILEKKALLADSFNSILNIKNMEFNAPIAKLQDSHPNFAKQLSSWKLAKTVDSKLSSEILLQSFTNESAQTQALFFMQSFRSKLPNCEDQTLLLAFVKMQEQLFTAAQSPTHGEIYSVLKNSNEHDINCLVLNLTINATEKTSYEPIYLLNFLNSRTTPHPMIPRLLASRLLKQKQYAETLRETLGLIEKNSYYRLAYDSIQRIYSTKQKGAGKVAIKGI